MFGILTDNSTALDNGIFGNHGILYRRARFNRSAGHNYGIFDRGALFDIHIRKKHGVIYLTVDIAAARNKRILNKCIR